MLAAIGIPEEDALSVMLTLDKLAEKALANEAITALMELIQLKEPILVTLIDKYSLQNWLGTIERYGGASGERNEH